MRSPSLAFNLEALSRVLAALPSQSVIGEINPLTTMSLGQGCAAATGVPQLCGENSSYKEFLPDSPNYEQFQRDAHAACTPLA
jgi:hypothetical protein